MTGYVRQSAGTIVSGGVITAAAHNNEFNALLAAFDGTTGHTHDGTTGSGPLLSILTSTSGTLTPARGGTGAATLTSNGVLIGAGTSTVVATTAGTANQVFIVPGAGGTPAFGAIDLTQAAAVTNALGVVNGGTGQSTYTNGQLLIGNTTGNTLAKATLTAGTAITITNGTGTISIAVTASTFQPLASQLTTLAAYNTNGLFTQTAAGTYTGRTITAGTGISVATGDGVSGNPTISIVNPVTVATGGSGAQTFTTHGVLLGEGTSAFGVTAVGTTGQVLRGQSAADPIWGQAVLTTDVTGILPTANGGTGVNAPTAHLLYVGNGASAMASVAIGSSTQVLTSNGPGADPTFQALPGAGVTSIADLTNGGLTFSASTGAVTAKINAGDLSTKATPTLADSVVIMDASATTVAKTATLTNLIAAQNIVTFKYLVTTSTNGAALTTQTWSLRNLAKVVDTGSVITVTTNTFTVSATGTWEIYGSFSAANTAGSSGFQTRLRNATDSTTTSLSTMIFAAANTCGTMQLYDRVTLTTGKTYQFETFGDSGSAGAVQGLGFSAGSPVEQGEFLNVLMRQVA